MAERTDEWPRVHTCLYNWCPKKSENCDRCDRIVAIIQKSTIDPDGGPRPRAFVPTDLKIY